MQKPLSPEGDRSEHLPLPAATFFVLFALAEGEKHGYRIMQDVKLLSSGSVSVGPATLYTTLQRLVDRALVIEVASPGDTRRRVYRLTPSGDALLQAEFRRQAEVLAMAKRRRVFAPGGQR